MTATLRAANTAQASSRTCRPSQEPTVRAGHRAVRPRGGQPVPDIAHGLHDVRAQLGAQAPHVHVHHVAPGVERVAPHLGQELFPGAHLPRPPHEVLEQEELPFGQADRASAGVRPPGHEVQADVAGLEDPVPGGRGGRLVEAGPEPGQELGEGEGLGQVVAGPELEAADLGVHVRQGGQDQDPLVGAGLEDPPKDGHPVQAREEEVEDHALVRPKGPDRGGTFDPPAAVPWGDRLRIRKRPRHGKRGSVRLSLTRPGQHGLRIVTALARAQGRVPVGELAQSSGVRVGPGAEGRPGPRRRGQGRAARG
jgi:hypothetical protein